MFTHLQSAKIHITIVIDIGIGFVLITVQYIYQYIIY